MYSVQHNKADSALTISSKKLDSTHAHSVESHPVDSTLNKSPFAPEKDSHHESPSSKAGNEGKAKKPKPKEDIKEFDGGIDSNGDNDKDDKDDNGNGNDGKTVPTFESPDNAPKKSTAQEDTDAMLEGTKDLEINNSDGGAFSPVVR